MANEKLRPVPGIAGLFVSPRGRYVVKTSARCEKTGRMRQGKRTLPPGASKTEAIQALASVKHDLASRDPAPGTATEMPTLKAYAPLWGKRQLSRGRWNPNGGTAEIVGYRLDKYVMPRIGDYLVDRITVPDLERWLDWMSTQVAARTTRAAYGHLKCLLREARKEHGLPPIVFPSPPAAPKDGKDVPLTWENYDRDNGMALTRDQLSMFLAAALQASPHEWYPLCLLGFSSGARFSELAGVHVDDLKLDEEIGIWLCRWHVIQRTKKNLPGIKWNRRGQVRLLDAESTRLLRPFLVGRAPGDLMFPSKQATTPFRTGNGLQWFLDVVSKETGLPRMTSKAFRQTYLTFSHLNAMADAMSQAQAGHSDARTTMTYVKPSIGHRKEHAKKMGPVLYPVPDEG